MSKTVSTIELLSPSPGTTRQLKVHRYGTPGAGPKAYFQAALHADEYPGLLVANHLIGLLDTADVEGGILGEVIVVPVANPIGLDQQMNGVHLGRYELDSGCNFNRAWPNLSEAVYQRVRDTLGDDAATNVGLIRAALTEAIDALEVHTELESLRKALLGMSMTADMVFDLHCDNDALMHLYASQRHHDLATELGCDIAAPVVLLEKDLAGSPFDACNAGLWPQLGALAGDAHPIPPACFATTVELRGRNDVHEDLASVDAAGLYRYLQRRGVVAGDPGPLPDALGQPTPLEGTDLIRAPGAGIVAYRRQIGDRVEAGEVIAELIDLLADDPVNARTPIISHASGLFFARMNEKLVRPGVELCKVAGSEPLAHRMGDDLLEA